MINNKAQDKKEVSETTFSIPPNTKCNSTITIPELKKIIQGISNSFKMVNKSFIDSFSGSGFLGILIILSKVAKRKQNDPNNLKIQLLK